MQNRIMQNLAELEGEIFFAKAARRRRIILRAVASLRQRAGNRTAPVPRVNDDHGWRCARLFSRLPKDEESGEKK